MRTVLNYILTGLLVTSLIFLTITQCSSSKKEKSIAKLQNELFACKNAPIRTDTIHDTLRIVEYRTIKPVAKPKPAEDDYGGVSPTTDTKCSSIASSYYSENYTAKGVKIHYEALTACNNDSSQLVYVRFPEILVPKETIIQTKTVHDTIPVKVPSKVRSKFAIYGGFTADNLKNFPGVELGIGYLHRQGWMLSAGALYMDNKPYGNLRIAIIF